MDIIDGLICRSCGAWLTGKVEWGTETTTIYCPQCEIDMATDKLDYFGFYRAERDYFVAFDDDADE